MACRCDGYDDDNNKKMKNQLEHERNLRCRAQSLAHKLAKRLEELGDLPAEFAEAVARERALLAAHKADEHAKDISALEASIVALRGQIEQVKMLGGDPSPYQARLLAQKIAKLTAMKAVTEKELLG